jgi:hypothetical protein
MEAITDRACDKLDQVIGRLEGRPISVASARGEYNENRAFSPQKATAARYNRSLFQRVAREIRYLADQWKINGVFSPINEFCGR